MGRLWSFINMPFGFHLILGAMLRLLLIYYAQIHDIYSVVKYTDIDYQVFTDAARHIVNGESPYRRHTYRYSPVIAFLLTPNIHIHPCFGKVLFSFFDVLIAIACKRIVEIQLRDKVSNAPSYCAQLWLYNPMSIVISTRGNADSVSCFFIIMSLYFLRPDLIRSPLVRSALAGIFLAISIHLRLYPLAFSFPMFLSLGSYDAVASATSVLHGFWLLMPNRKQVMLALSCIFTLVGLTYGFYQLYGYEFLYETYIYHLFRKDMRHNFSIMFYYFYLTMEDLNPDMLTVVPKVFEVLILIFISLSYGLKQDSLPFALFCQAVVLVAYNSVITSQYFIWFLSLLPLVAHNFEIPLPNALYVSLPWVFSQAGWLCYAYMLEFENQQVFFYVWLKGLFFYGAHIHVLGQLIRCYKIGFGFGLKDYSRAKKVQ